jgi:hypothetical protein
MTREQVLQVWSAISMMEGVMIGGCSPESLKNFSEFCGWEKLERAQKILKDELLKD